jgi:nitrogen fixation protein
MILELGGASAFIQVTAQYSNAVLVAVLPYFTDVAKKLDLPVPIPITQADIAKVDIWPGPGAPGASILLKNNWSFGFLQGYVYAVQNTHDKVIFDSEPTYGPIKITAEDTVKTARDTLRKLGIAPEDVFSDFEPKVTPPNQIGTNVTYPYQVEWFDEMGSRTVDMRIDPHTGKLDRLYLHHFNLERPPPKIDVVPPPEDTGHDSFSSMIPPHPSPEYALKLIPIMLKAIDAYGGKLSLPITRPLTTNNLAKIEVYNNGGWPHCEIWLTNGWRFIYRHTMVNGYDTPDRLGKRGPMHIKDFAGKWNLTTNQAIEVVKAALAKLDYPTNNVHMDFEPTVIIPAGEFKKIIPRYMFEWYYKDGSGHQTSRIEAEVNADNGKLESLFYDDKAYWDSRPPIDVPISVKN